MYVPSPGDVHSGPVFAAILPPVPLHDKTRHVAGLRMFFCRREQAVPQNTTRAEGIEDGGFVAGGAGVNDDLIMYNQDIRSHCSLIKLNRRNKSMTRCCSREISHYYYF